MYHNGIQYNYVPANKWQAIVEADGSWLITFWAESMLDAPLKTDVYSHKDYLHLSSLPGWLVQSQGQSPLTFNGTNTDGEPVRILVEEDTWA